MLECYWYLPPPGCIKVNTDGASSGNPGNAGWATIYRDHNGTVIGTYIEGLGVIKNYEAKSTAVVEGITKAIEQGWLHIWVQWTQILQQRLIRPFKLTMFCGKYWQHGIELNSATLM
ncbi:hypothetical protein IFM89_011311 [Coptis chinensis]|uniref:RNase H type-1 domain-containing protein n=1 Tax=Coptis chinensis TaxID=261450 RepID=A0A835LVM7_9MAGN|nr:hypothetical protein IFM89_011311 [Coptis chinensis]